MARQTEPNPWAYCRFEQEAREPDAPTCAFCDCVEVAEEGDFCSEACEAEASAEDAAEHASDLARGC